jgi:hypothetical protein
MEDVDTYIKKPLDILQYNAIGDMRAINLRTKVSLRTSAGNLSRTETR